jgi:hypothetical protein
LSARAVGRQIFRNEAREFLTKENPMLVEARTKRQSGPSFA